MVDISELKNLYFQNSLDVPYTLKKGGEIFIKPILVKDYPLYEYSAQILTMKKNEINDIKIIQMSYLDFLIEVVLPKDEVYIYQLLTLLQLCLGEEYISYDKDKNGKYSLLICDENNIIQKAISRKEFDDISEIILNQNDANYDSRYVNPDVQEVMNTYYKQKYGDVVQPSLEKKKAFVCSKTGKTFKELNDVPYREFDLIYSASVDSEIYIGQKIIQGSYKYEVKEDIKHPLFEKKKDPYAEVFDDPSILSSKGISGANQLNAMNMAQD